MIRYTHTHICMRIHTQTQTVVLLIMIHTVLGFLERCKNRDAWRRTNPKFAPAWVLGKVHTALAGVTLLVGVAAALAAHFMAK